MKLAWKNLTKGTPDKAADFKEAWADSENFRLFLKELLEERIRAEREKSEREAYDIENWALKQADANGVIRTYKEIIGLLDK
jgi:hypothetical protein